MTFNTSNPIGSTDARDRSDNSENLDLAVNSLSQTFVDRLGVTRDTLEGIYQKSAYYRAGTFDAGYTLTNNRQTLAYGNVEYSWSGTFPKVVSAGTTPETSGGIGAGAWIDRTQETLRSEFDALSANVADYYAVECESYRTIKQAIDAAKSALVDGKIYDVASFYDGWSVDSVARYMPAGGGRFVYDANMPKSKHDGGTIISVTVPFDGKHSGVSAWLSGTGETSPTGNGCLVRLDIKELNLLWFGATRVHPDDNTAPINKFKSVWNAGKLPGYIPFGEYRTTERFLVDCSLFAGRNIQPLRGDGPGVSRLFSDSATGPVFHWYGGNVSIFDHFQGKIESLEMIADCATAASFAIGKSDFSDSHGNYNIKNILVRNVNTALSDNATAIELNYLFDCVFENVVAVGAVNHGSALKLRQTRFSNFIGGSYSNAKWGIVFDAGVSDGNTFTSPDIENVTFGVSSFTASAGSNKFIGGFVDIWDSFSMTFPSSGYALNIQQCSAGKFTFDGTVFTRSQTYPYTGSNFQLDAYADNVILRGKYAGQTTPTMLASDAQTTNHTGQPQRVRIYGGTVTDIYVGGAFTGFTKGDFILLPGEAIAIRYSVTPTWTWTAVVS